MCFPVEVPDPAILWVALGSRDASGGVVRVHFSKMLSFERLRNIGEGAKDGSEAQEVSRFSSDSQVKNSIPYRRQERRHTVTIKKPKMAGCGVPSYRPRYEHVLGASTWVSLIGLQTAVMHKYS